MSRPCVPRDRRDCGHALAQVLPRQAGRTEQSISGHGRDGSRSLRGWMGRLIVISNRVNPPVEAGVGTSGGLAMALAAALREYSGVWFGWSGQTTETFTGQLTVQKVGGVTVALVDLEEQDRQEYYNGYANKTLWPLFHYRMD